MAAPARYHIPVERFRSEIEVEPSRFIATVQPVATPAAAPQVIAAVTSEFPDANHNCWAYLVGPPGSTDQVGLSDDGEPHGAAGKPMLIALQHSGLGDMVVVVSRYFGGIKLGKGGMVKAYTAAVKTALDQVPRCERVNWLHLLATIDYALVTPFEHKYREYEAEILDVQYGERVTYRLRIPDERQKVFRAMFADLTAGRGLLENSD